MGAGLVASMVSAYGDPRGAMARQRAEGWREARVLAHVFIACGLGFLASLPDAIRTARTLDIGEPVAAAVSAHLFGYFLIAPLVLYGVAALVHLAARGFGGGGGFLGARAAVAWSALLAGPIALAVALAAAVAASVDGGPAPWLSWLGYAGLATWAWLFAASLAEAEGFAATGRVAVVVVAAFGAIAASVSLLTRGVAGTG